MISVLIFHFMHLLIEEGSLGLIDSPEPALDFRCLEIEEEQEHPSEPMKTERAITRRSQPLMLPESPVVGVPLDTVFGVGPAAMDPSSVCAVAPATPDLHLTSLADFKIGWMKNHRAFKRKQVYPHYPSMALIQKVEGWVEVQFTVSKTGSVSQARVTRAFPQEIFDLAALAAIRQWKYIPRVVDGKEVDTPEMSARFIFDLQGVRTE